MSSTVNIPWTDIFQGASPGSVAPVASIVALKAIKVNSLVTGSSILVLGYYAAGDGGGGIFYYNSSSSTTENSGMIVQPTSGSGRWFRAYSGAVDLKWFGAKGDGTTDDTTAIQKAFDWSSSGGSICAAFGRYMISSRITFTYSKTNFYTLTGASLEYLTTVGSSDVMLYSLNKSDCSISGWKFVGNGVDPVTLGTASPAMQFVTSQRFSFRNCEGYNFKGAFISCASCDYVTVESNYIHDNGQTYSSPPGGTPVLPAISFGQGGSGTQGGDGNKVLNNHIKNCECGVLMYANEGIITGNTIESVGEAGINANFLTSTVSANKNIISNNIIFGVFVSIFTATGMEVIGNDVVITGNIVRNCQADGISIRGGRYTVSNNHIFNNGTVIGSSSGIVVLNDGASVLLAYGFDFVITDNVIYDSQSSPTQAYGIRVVAVNGGSTLFQRVNISGNSITGDTAADLYVQPLCALDDTFVVKNNSCWPDRYSNNVTVTIPSDTSQHQLGAYSIPAGSMMDKESVVMETSGNISGTAGTKLLFVLYGSINPFLYTVPSGTTGEWKARVVISNKNVRNSQTLDCQLWVDQILVLSSTTISSQDSTVSKVLGMECQKSVGADTITGEQFRIMRL